MKPEEKNGTGELSVKSVVNHAVMTGLEHEDPDISIQSALEAFGESIVCDRICIFEDSSQTEGYVDSTYEWCAEGASSIKGIMQGIPYHGVWDDCVRNLDQRQLFIIADRDEYREKTDNQRGYEAMLEWGTKRLIAYPLYIGNSYFGFVRIDNPPADAVEQEHIGSILKALSGFFAPMIRLRDNMDKMQKLSERDSLTETFTLTTLQERIHEYYLENKDYISNMYIVYLNVINLRGYNMNSGMEKGNSILVSVSKILEKVFRTKLVSRIAGDRFAVFYTKKDVVKCVQEVHEECLMLDEEAPVHVKMGITDIKDDSNLPKKFVDAKAACERLGERTSMFYGFVSQELETELEKDHYILDHFEEALKMGEIKVYFQPVIRTMTEKVCSFEALARWHDDNYGVIPPGDFVPVLEEHELCWKLDSYIAEKVCESMHKRLSLGLPVVPVSINMSRNDFFVSDPFGPLRTLEKLCEKYSIDHRYICVEMTESEVMHMSDKIRKVIDESRKAGFRIWMDDFGSAYSSLNALGRFSFDKIKLDRGFVSLIDDNSKIIVRAAIWMAKELGVHTLCEGVEKREQLDFLREIGCEEIQGYYYSRPAPLEEVLLTLEKKGIKFESEAEAEAMEKVGNIHFTRDSNRMTVICRGDVMESLHASTGMLKILKGMGISDMSDIVGDRSLANPRKIGALLRSAMHTEGEQRTIISIDEKTYLFICRKVASFGNNIIELAEAIDITVMQDNTKYGYIYYCAANAYEIIYVLDERRGLLEVVQSTDSNEKPGSFISPQECSFLEKMHRDDRKRFMKIMDRENRENIVRRMQHGSYTTIFRMLRDDGRYEWMACTIIDAVIREKHRILLCIKPSAVEDYIEREHLIATRDKMKFPYRVENYDSDRRMLAEGSEEDGTITREGETIRNLKIENMTDHLTGVYNRRYFDRMVAGKQVGAAAFLDIDNFKKINDDYGHGMGDMILKSVAERIRGNLRSTDIVIRYGGDEFVIIFDNISIPVLERRLQEIHDSVRQVALPEDEYMHEIEVSISIGACCRPGIAEDLIRQADRNMYRSKTNRKGTITVTS